MNICEVKENVVEKKSWWTTVRWKWTYTIWVRSRLRQGPCQKAKILLKRYKSELGYCARVSELDDLRKWCARNGVRWFLFLVLIVEETFQRIGLNKKEHLETNLKKSNAIVIICRFIDILLRYLPEHQHPGKIHSFYQTLELLKKSVSKMSQLNTDAWNDVLKDANIGNDISFFASKGDKYAIPRKSFQILDNQHRPINPIWPGTWFLLHHLSIKLDIEANRDEKRWLLSRVLETRIIFQSEWRFSWHMWFHGTLL